MTLESDYNALIKPEKPFIKAISMAIMNQGASWLGSTTLAIPPSDVEKSVIRMILAIGVMKDDASKSDHPSLKAVRVLVSGGLATDAIDSVITTAVNTHFLNLAKMFNNLD